MPHNSDEQPDGARFVMPAEAYPAQDGEFFNPEQITITGYPEAVEGQRRILAAKIGPTLFEPGLTWWSSAPSLLLSDLGRLTTAEALDLSTLDLRVILAHLDSAARAITTALEGR